ncbi:ACP S-malonyltransferase [Fluviibacter phosphoraccumulans]|uniref:Malonyl CoA-acyl carrier protein transacylase n=1 Tax=Fluviibacter phosphoraccumulans TaxID=1751046 RepID=A0A679I963_9RHOO|nr:ACP S-malonyltransferase [Fluviibacter phosphoraccumulans]BBU69433.1 malonyl CoA-acyl carrier protein transacylase [Fluviibacter phosphoraccumulans]BBU71384.1 malonyl CoA-acyl carrier protein transacylase [Fluviibacter phosphoraccumulans]BCA65369.1 malonyl CoA-acyl carrier protein transacylase [Fluviibacter phosphoraccumulans]
MSFAFVFPGQGSQSVGMMAAYGDSPVVRATFDEASAALGEDLWTMVAEGPAERLSQTVNTQPIMLTAGVAVWRLWESLGGKMPAVVAGHSLGEYSALVAAGSLKLADAVPLVRLRAAAMQEAVPVGTGAMAAILGLDEEGIAAACAEAAQGEVVEPVNFNAPGQTVIAGHKGAVERACEACKARGAKRAVLLPVSAPFHSSLLKPAADRLAVALADITLNTPLIPVVNNVDVAIETDPAKIKDALVRQAAKPVRWVETIQKIAGMGVATAAECGPGKVLAGLTKRCADGITGVALADAESVNANLTLN